MDSEARYAAATAGDSKAIVDWEKQADLDFDYEAIYHTLTKYRDEHQEFIREKLANKKLLFKLNGDDETALHLAAERATGSLYACEDLIGAARLLDSRPDTDIEPSRPTSAFYEFVWHPNLHKETALHLALTNGYLDIAERLISESSTPRSGHDIKNHLGETPVYLAVKFGYGHIIKRMCECWRGSVPLDGPDDTATALHIAIVNFPREREEAGLITEMIDSRDRYAHSYIGFEPVFEKTDKNFDTILSLSVRENQFQVVETILAEDPAYQSGRVRKSKDLKSLVSIVPRKSEEEHTRMVNLLIKNYEARKDIGHEHQNALHKAIIKSDGDSVLRLLEDRGDYQAIETDSEHWTPLHYAAYYDFESILDEIRVGFHAVRVNEYWVPTPIHVAAREGHTSTLIKLMKLSPTSLCFAPDLLTSRNILHLAVLASEKEMIQHIIAKCPEVHINQILNLQDVNGDTPLHLLIRDGCFVRKLIKHEKVDRTLKNKQQWTSFDMLYFKDQIVADQVKIKKALDDFQAEDKHQNLWQRFMFWQGSINKNSKMPKSLVAPGRLRRKDIEFEKGKKLLMKENLMQMKDELDRYRQRTNTQIIVTALITTVAFTVGFTMPGGYYQDGDLKGMVVLSNKKAFVAFMVCDTLALLLSTSSLFLYFIASMYEDPHNVSRLNNASTVLNIISVIAMMLTFITGTFLVLSHSQALAITVCVISGSFFLLVLIGLLIKWRYDRRQEKLDEV